MPKSNPRNNIVKLVTEVSDSLREFKAVLADGSYSMTIYQAKQVEHNIALLERAKAALETAERKETALRQMLATADRENWDHIYPADVEEILDQNAPE
jgi:hypothetical protein